MSLRRALVPISAAVIGLAGSLAATLYLHREATGAVDRVLQERLRAAGESAAFLLSDLPLQGARLGDLMRANRLDGAYLVDPSLTVLADADGAAGRRADLLRTDPALVEKAFTGEASLAPSYTLGELEVVTGYFPVRDRHGEVIAVLSLEAGKAFAQPKQALSRALAIGGGLAVLGALALAVVAARWAKSERLRREDAARAARGETLSRMAAMAAHEIRNPLSVIRGTAELMRERLSSSASARDREALDDVLGEVERLRRLTEDFLDLSADRPMAKATVDVGPLLAEAARGAERAFPDVKVRANVGALPVVEGDPGRLRQVFANLLANAAQAQIRGEIELEARDAGRELRILLRDHGPGVAPELRERLFDPFVTAKSGGTGLGLAVCRRWVERHGGTLALLEQAAGERGATFEIRLPTMQNPD